MDRSRRLHSPEGLDFCRECDQSLTSHRVTIDETGENRNIEYKSNVHLARRALRPSETEVGNSPKERASLFTPLLKRRIPWHFILALGLS